MVFIGIRDPSLNQFWSLVFLGISDPIFKFGQNLGQEFLSKKKLGGTFFAKNRKKLLEPVGLVRFLVEKTDCMIFSVRFSASFLVSL